MSIPPELIQLMAQHLLGRTNLPDELVVETAERLSGVLVRIRSLDETRLRDLLPAMAFDPTHSLYRQPPAGVPAWTDLATARGSSGYAGAKGITGVTAPPPAPRPMPMESPEWLWWDATTLVTAIRRKELAPTEVVEAVLARIEALEPTLNAFVTLTADAARAAARAVEEKLARGEDVGPLAGVPVAIKDLYETAGVRTTAGSRVLADYVPTHDATAVRRLREAGAVSVGKTATHEFAFGPTTDSPYLGPTRNPWHTDHVPAGSSGGSGAAVAAGIVPLALGTDTGGSIRMPAAACGIVGLKPTYGRVSKFGVLPLSWSLDHVGPLARSVADVALALRVLAGPDPLDPTATATPLDDYTAAVERARDGLQGLRLGVPTPWLEEYGVDPEVRAAFDRALDTLRDLGASVEEATLPPADVMTFVNRIITLGEAGAYHADLLARHAEEYAPDVRARLELAQFILARDYLTGQRLRTELSQTMAAVMTEFDALLTPTMPIPAPCIGQNLWTYPDGSSEPVQEAMIRYTAPFSVSGQPALSVPCGFTAEGLPIGLQIVGRPFEEATVLRIGAAFEAIAGFRDRRPGFAGAGVGSGA